MFKGGSLARKIFYFQHPASVLYPKFTAEVIARPDGSSFSPQAPKGPGPDWSGPGSSYREGVNPPHGLPQGEALKGGLGPLPGSLRGHPSNSKSSEGGWVG